MKVCYCEGCHKKFYGNSRCELYYSEANILISQDRHSVYEMCNDCITEFKSLMDSVRLENLKTNFADDFKNTIEKKVNIKKELPKELLKKRCKTK